MQSIYDISWLSSQYSAYIAIKHLLDCEDFTSTNTYIEVPNTQEVKTSNYEETPLLHEVYMKYSK